MKSWVQTFDEQKVWLPVGGHDGDFSALTLTALSEQMARVVRFGGAMPKPYGLAQHSVIVARLAERMARDAGDLTENQIALARFLGLMHDAAELYTGDMAGPLKANLPDQLRADLRALEGRIYGCLRAWAGLPSWVSPIVARIVKRADVTACAWEARDLFPATVDDWHLSLGVEIPGEVLRTMTIKAAAVEFRKEFRAAQSAVRGAKARAEAARKAWAQGGPAR